MLEDFMSAKTDSKETAAQPGVRAHGLAFSKEQLRRSRPKLPSPGKLAMAKPPQRRRQQLDKPGLDEEQSLNSLRRQLSHIILKFLRTKLRSIGKSGDSAALKAVLWTARTYAYRPGIFRGNSPVQLPDPVTIRQLFERTKPDFRKEELDASELGKWLSVVLLTVAGLSGTWEGDLDAVEQKLFPPPRPVKPVAPRRRRPLKPYEMRLRDWAKTH